MGRLVGGLTEQLGPSTDPFGALCEVQGLPEASLVQPTHRQCKQPSQYQFLKGNSIKAHQVFRQNPRPKEQGQVNQTDKEKNNLEKMKTRHGTEENVNKQTGKPLTATQRWLQQDRVNMNSKNWNTQIKKFIM